MKTVIIYLYKHKQFKENWCFLFLFYISYCSLFLFISVTNELYFIESHIYQKAKEILIQLNSYYIDSFKKYYKFQ